MKARLEEFAPEFLARVNFDDREQSARITVQAAIENLTALEGRDFTVDSYAGAKQKMNDDLQAAQMLN
eukprot:8247185-Pyramimonas_sp.AAC.1